MVRLTVKRVVTMKECPWLDRDIKAGETFYRFTGPTYGCIGPNGVAVSIDPNISPFFELPRQALETHHEQ